MMVRIMAATGEKAYGDGSALDFWRAHGGQAVPEKCPVLGCVHRTSGAAKVQQSNSFGGGRFVVPMCGFHLGQVGAILNVLESVALVPLPAGKSPGQGGNGEGFGAGGQAGLAGG